MVDGSFGRCVPCSSTGPPNNHEPGLCFQLRPRFGKIACPPGPGKPRSQAPQAGFAASRAGKARAWAAISFRRPPSTHNLVGPRWKLRFCAPFGSKFARYTVPEWLLVRSCRVETDGSGPRRNCGGILQIPGFQVQMPSNVVRVPCPLHCCRWSWSPSPSAQREVPARDELVDVPPMTRHVKST